MVAELVIPGVSSAPVEGSVVGFGSASTDKGGIGSGIGLVVGTSPVAAFWVSGLGGAWPSVSVILRQMLSNESRPM